MLWKIRSGYVVVLYGALTIIGGTSGLIAMTDPERNRLLLAAVLLVCGFSLCGLVVDFFFLRAKFRVVNDTNDLWDLALRVATGKTTIEAEEAEYDTLREPDRLTNPATYGCRWLDGAVGGWAGPSGPCLCGSCFRAGPPRPCFSGIVTPPIGRIDNEQGCRELLHISGEKPKKV
jgi:hypothetical protein